TGAVFTDLDTSGGTGLITVPAASTSLILENGVEVTFTVDPDPVSRQQFRSGDYWVFTARTANAYVEELKAAPPRAVHHHYGRLALVTFPDVVFDCRTFWPPLLGGEGQTGDCTLCVTAAEHNNGTFGKTLYEAVDQLLMTGGTICLGTGTFNLNRQ